MDSVTHTYGSNTTTDTTISSTKETTFKNLRSTQGAVTFTASWTAPTFTLPKISKTGHTCKWQSSGISDIASGNTFTPAGGETSRTFTASCTVNAYTATFNGNSCGTPSSTGITKNYDVALGTLPSLNNLTSGYTFDGWYTASSGGSKIDTTTKMPGYNPTYYAHCSAATYSISYNLGGGSLPSGTTNPTTYTVNSNAITLNNPTRVGYHFAGWTGSNGTTAQNSVTIAKGSTGNKSYTANWNAHVCTINFDPNGGSFGTNSSNTVQTLKYGETKTNFWNANGGTYSASKTGYHIDAATAWIKNGTSTTYNETADYAVASICPNIATNDETVTLKANWKINVCTITYSPNDGKFNDHTTNTVETLNYGASTGDMRNAKGGYYSATRNYYYINASEAWFRSGTDVSYNQDNGYNASDFCPDIASGNQSVTLKVKWRNYKVKIAYHANGASLSNSSYGVSNSTTYHEITGGFLSEKVNNKTVTTFNETNYANQYTGDNLNAPTYYFSNAGKTGNYWVLQNHAATQCPNAGICVKGGTKADIHALIQTSLTDNDNGQNDCVLDDDHHSCVIVLCGGWL